MFLTKLKMATAVVVTFALMPAFGGWVFLTKLAPTTVAAVGVEVAQAELIAQPPGAKTATDDPADGVYLISLQGEGQKVKRNDTGDFLVLGKRLTDKLGQATIRSIANDNSRFAFDLTGAGPFPDGQPGQVALLIGGRCFVVGSRSDPQANVTYNLGSLIVGEEAMQTVAKRFKVEPTLRTHPGYQLLVTWRPDKPGYKVGALITLTLNIKNVGTQTIAFVDGGSQRGPRDNQFGFTAFYNFGKPVPDTGDPENDGGKGSLKRLQPAQVFSKTVRLNDWFKFKETGSYLITGSYHLEFQDPKTFKEILWTDYASGTCVVRIVE